jgi:hypothetical protein
MSAARKSELFAMSCRVIGLGVEDTFCNGPARNLLPSHGFTPADSHAWELALS